MSMMEKQNFRWRKKNFNKHRCYEFKTSPYITIPKTIKKTMKETYDYFMEAHKKTEKTFTNKLV